MKIRWVQLKCSNVNKKCLNNILETDGRFENSDPVIFEPDILSNNGVVSARIHRKAAIDCRKLLIEKIKSGQLGKVRSR